MSSNTDFIIPVGIVAILGYAAYKLLGGTPSTSTENTFSGTPTITKTGFASFFPLSSQDQAFLNGTASAPSTQSQNLLSGLFSNMFNNAAGQPNAQGATTPATPNISPAQNNIARAQAAAYYSGGTYNTTSGILSIGGTGYSVAPSKVPSQIQAISAQSKTGFSRMTNPNNLINPVNIFNQSPYNL